MTRKEISKRYREKNKKEIKEKARLRYEENKEEINKRERLKRIDNKEESLKKDKIKREKNKEKISEINKKYRENNKEKITESNKKYREDNKEKIFESNKKYRENNKEKVSKSKADYKKNNREKINIYNRIKLKSDIYLRIKCNLRTRLYIAVKGTCKSASTMELVGCSIEELLIHLSNQFTEGMSFENYGQWHVDHIRPCSSFNLLNEEEQKSCFHYTNLQPLWAEDNLKKGSKFNIFVAEST